MEKIEKIIDYGCSKNFRPEEAFGHCWGGSWEPAAGVDPGQPNLSRACHNCACYHGPIVKVVEIRELSEMHCNFRCIFPDGSKCANYDDCVYAPPF